ncbi:hypothetical protein LPA44_04070 [Halobacterium sp. KA-4]|uniref:hypothetical protein n=1 Tax=Halobacterium sp. KA-4 TaxID=2896367 RepID=UPI001E5CB013|nr:hypothetical protein [Halobacterium sp. KA-4]MCD2199075.1 hypothetical protein [Halobacterium sp. KA-4]
MELNRRKFIGGTVALTAGLAGCTDAATNDTGGSETTTEAPTPEPTTEPTTEPQTLEPTTEAPEPTTESPVEQVFDDEIDDAEQQTTQRVKEDWIDENTNILEDQYYQFSWEWEESWEIEYEFVVRDGPAVDVFIAADSEFTHYEEGERFKYFGDTLDSAGGSDTVRLDPGSYHLVIDNSELVEAQPPSNFDEDPAQVEIKATVRGI